MAASSLIIIATIVLIASVGLVAGLASLSALITRIFQVGPATTPAQIEQYGQLNLVAQSLGLRARGDHNYWASRGHLRIDLGSVSAEPPRVSLFPVALALGEGGALSLGDEG